MATAAQSAASRLNGARGQGPTSERGRLISSKNSLKHGFRSERVAEEVESSSALEERRRTWLAQCDAQTDMDEFLITSNVVLSFNLERVWRAAAACLDREKEDADDKAIDRARELGSRLYFDPTGPISKYGIETVVFDKIGTSSSGGADDAYQPAKLVNELESTMVGCRWLLHEWELLKDRAVNGIWYSPDRLKAVRLLGFQPVDAIDQWCVAMIFVASNGFMRLGETGFEDLLSDMSPVALERLVLRVKARFGDLFFDWTEIEYRQMLIDLIDENVLALQAQLEWHKTQNARCGGDRKGDELAFDYSTRGASMRQYELRCKTSFERGVARFNKQAQDRVKRAAKRVAGRDGSGAEGVETYGRGDGGDPPGARDPRRTSDGGGDEPPGARDPRRTSGLEGCTDQERREERKEKREETYGRDTGGVRDPRRTSDGGGERPGDGDARRARAEGWERVEQKLDASDIRACGGFLPLGRTGLASGTLAETAGGAADVECDGRSGESVTAADGGEGFRTRRPPTAACGGTSPASGEVGFAGGRANATGGEWGETSASADPSAAWGGTSRPDDAASFTNEPELHEDVILSQDQEIVEVVADSGVDSGLDKVADLPGAGGREHEADVEYPEFDEEVLVGDEPTGDDGRSLGAGRTTRSVGEAVPTRSVATRRVENRRSGCEASVNGGTSRLDDAASFTNEPELHEDVSLSQDKEVVEVAADSGVDSGLDKGGIDGDFDGGETDGGDCGEAVRVRRPPTAACGGTSPTRVEVKRSVGEAAPTQSVGARGIEKSSSERGETFRTRQPPNAERSASLRARRPPAAACGGTSTTGGEEELLAIETVKRQARAGPMADAIRDLLASSPEAMEILKPFLPGNRPVSVVSGQLSVAEDLGVHRESLPRAP